MKKHLAILLLILSCSTPEDGALIDLNDTSENLILNIKPNGISISEYVIPRANPYYHYRTQRINYAKSLTVKDIVNIRRHWFYVLNNGGAHEMHVYNGSRVPNFDSISKNYYDIWLSNGGPYPIAGPDSVPDATVSGPPTQKCDLPGECSAADVL